MGGQARWTKHVTLVLEGRPVSQKNSKQIRRDRHGRPFVGSNDGVLNWRAFAVAALSRQWHGFEPYPKALHLAVHLRVYLAKGQSMDVDNAAQGPLDALQKAKVIENDSQIVRLVVEKFRDPDRPRVEIAIAPLVAWPQRDYADPYAGIG